MVKEGGGLPLTMVLTNGGMPPEESLQAEIQAAVNVEYSNYPFAPTGPGKGGKGGFKGGFKGGAPAGGFAGGFDGGFQGGFQGGLQGGFPGFEAAQAAQGYHLAFGIMTPAMKGMMKGQGQFGSPY